MHKGEASNCFEGGAIDSNGRGTLLTPQECFLMHPDIQVRTRFFTKEDYEAVFKDILNHQCDLARNELKATTLHGHTILSFC
jgi:agmatine deiminase